MSVDKLITTLKKEAELQEKAVLAEARKEADNTALSAGKKAAEIDEQIRKIEAELEAKKEYLQNSQKILLERRKKSWLENEYLDAFKTRCRELYRDFMSSGEYKNFIEREFKKVQAKLENIEEVRADTTTVKALNDSLKGSVKVSVDETVTEGFLVIASGGKIKILSNFEGRFQKVWSETAPKYVKQIVETISQN